MTNTTSKTRIVKLESVQEADAVKKEYVCMVWPEEDGEKREIKLMPCMPDGKGETYTVQSRKELDEFTRTHDEINLLIVEIVYASQDKDIQHG